MRLAPQEACEIGAMAIPRHVIDAPQKRVKKAQYPVHTTDERVVKQGGNGCLASFALMGVKLVADGSVDRSELVDVRC